MNTQTTNIQNSLIDGLKKNDRKAQLQAYNMYYKAMYNAAFRILQDGPAAEDVMQESFLTAFRKIVDFKGDATFGAWLKRIVINRSIDEVKKRKETVSIEETEMEIRDEGSTEDYLEILAYRVDQIRDGMEQLQNDDRLILSLFLLEGYDHEEISQLLEISNNASRARYSRARQRLRNLLKQNKIDELVN